MPSKIKIAILDDHQSIVDGYLFRLSMAPEVEVVATAAFGEDLEPMLATYATDILILDVSVPASADNPNPYPVLHMIPRLIQLYPSLHILVISMHSRHTLIKAVMEAGASGYILKDDRNTIQNLGAIVSMIANGGIHFSQQAYQQLRKHLAEKPELSPRQLEVLSLCATYPDESTAELAKRLNVANSTARNLLSDAYTKLDVRTRIAAIGRARHLGLITPLEQVVAE
ncbi:MAG: response regulator transcription factor [Chloroflexi bacterium]|nr:response regulator transcription factor [Chloroflexota bacterium]